MWVMMMVMNAGSWPEPVPVQPAAAPLRTDDPLLTLFAQQYAPMVRLATALLGSRAVAEEVVQEAFLRVEPRLPDLELGGHAAYLRRSVVNGARSSRRRDNAAKRQAIPLQEHSSSPEDHAVLREDQRRLLVLLDELPFRQRQCLVLRYYEGLTDVEVAEAVGIAVGSAKTHIRRGLEALKQRSEELR